MRAVNDLAEAEAIALHYFRNDFGMADMDDVVNALVQAGYKAEDYYAWLLPQLATAEDFEN